MGAPPLPAPRADSPPSIAAQASSTASHEASSVSHDEARSSTPPALATILVRRRAAGGMVAESSRQHTRRATLLSRPSRRPNACASIILVGTIAPCPDTSESPMIARTLALPMSNASAAAPATSGRAIWASAREASSASLSKMRRDSVRG